MCCKIPIQTLSTLQNIKGKIYLAIKWNWQNLNELFGKTIQEWLVSQDTICSNHVLSPQQLNKYICTFPQLFNQTLKINQFECKKYLHFTKETLSQCYSQSTFSRQEKVLNAQLGEAYLLQQLNFEINKKKCQLVPVPKIKFLGLVVNSVSMTSPLRENK